EGSHDLAAEAMGDPGRALDPGSGDSLFEVGDVGLQVPGRLPPRGAVAAQVDRGDRVAEPAEPLGQPLEDATVLADAVDADDGGALDLHRRPAAVQLHWAAPALSGPAFGPGQARRAGAKPLPLRRGEIIWSASLDGDSKGEFIAGATIARLPSAH